MKTLFPIRNGIIAQTYDDNALPELYKSLGLKSHAGVDITSHHKDLIFLSESGTCYKVWDEIAPSIGSVSHGFGVNVLTDPNENGVCKEFVFWHMRSNLRVKEGQWYEQGTILGEEGASGDVYSNGVPIPDSQKGIWPYLGTHLHWGYREVQRTKNENDGVCLSGPDFQKYKDKEGYFYKVLNWENGNLGWLDPMKLDIILYDAWILSKTEKIVQKTALILNNEIYTSEQKRTFLEQLSNYLKNLISFFTKKI